MIMMTMIMKIMNLHRRNRSAMIWTDLKSHLCLCYVYGPKTINR